MASLSQLLRPSADARDGTITRLRSVDLPDITRRADRILHRVRLVGGIAFAAVILVNGPVLHADTPRFTALALGMASLVIASAMAALRASRSAALPAAVAYMAVAIDAVAIGFVGQLTDGPWGSMPLVLLLLVALHGLHLRYGPLLFAASCATAAFLAMDHLNARPVPPDRLLVHLTIYWLMALAAAGLVQMSGHLTTTALRRQRAWLELEHRFGRHLGPQVAQILVDAPDLLRVSQRREVTALFADLSGFTHLVESVPGEIVLETLDAYFSLFVRVAQQQGGWVDHFEGDGVLVIFNAPLDQPDHAARAVATARSMMSEIRLLNQIRSREGRPVLGLRVGINSGSVHVGLIGGSERVQYTAIGDAMNVAFRLEGMGGPGQILVGKRTAELASLGAGDFEICQVRGRATPVHFLRLTEDSAPSQGLRYGSYDPVSMPGPS